MDPTELIMALALREGISMDIDPESVSICLVDHNLKMTTMKSRIAVPAAIIAGSETRLMRFVGVCGRLAKLLKPDEGTSRHLVPSTSGRILDNNLQISG